MNDNKKFPIAKEGYPFICGGAILFALCLVVPGWLGALLAAVFTLFSLWFFRDPERTTGSDRDLVVSPADGRVVEVGVVEKAPYLDAPALKIGIFMSPFNVHVNRIPISGAVESVKHTTGQFINAAHERASVVNEHNAVIIQPDDYKSRVMMVQVAGFVARRIVCYLKPGDKVTKGTRFGLIRFGSRVDLYLPVDAIPLVTPGCPVTAGESTLGRMK